MAAQQPTQDTRAAYQAPLRFHNHPDRVADQYVVYLEIGHDLELHKQRVKSSSLSDAIITVFNFDDKISYAAKMDANLLASVRGDPGVELVECDLYAYAAMDA